MWKYFKLIIGLFLVLCFFAGTASVLRGDVEKRSRHIAENGVDVMGTINEVTRHIVVARWGKVAGGGVYYTIKYTFPTKDGRKYSGEIKVSKDDAQSADTGQPILVRYYADQPSINSPLDYREYMSVEDARDMPKGTIFFSALLMLAGGLWMVW